MMIPAIKDISLNSKVDKTLTEIEKSIVRQGIPSIRKSGKQDSINKLGSIVDMIGLDVGIQSVDVYYKTRFIQMVYKYYGDLTINEIKLAFELLITGGLDEYLPKSQGQPDRSHYSKFSAEYISKVLTAYNKYKNKVKMKVLAASPEEEITAEKIKESKQKFVHYLQKVFESYRDDLEETDLRFPITALIFFKAARITKTIPKPDQIRIKEYINDERSFKLKTKLFKDISSSSLGGVMQSYGERKYYNSKIMEVFDYLIEKNKEIKDYEARYIGQY